jgi:hypothetical protein
MRLRRALLQDQVTVKPYLGETAYGPKWGDPVTVRVLADRTVKLTRDATGAEVVSSTQLLVHPGTTGAGTDTPIGVEALFTENSLVTDGAREAEVITVHRIAHRGRLCFLQVDLT